MTEPSPIRAPMFGNGRKPFLIAAFLLVGLTFASMVLMLVVLVTVAPEPNPLRYSNPQSIINLAPSYKPGDVFMDTVTKCNRGDKEVRITGTSFWVPVDASGSQAVEAGTGSRVLEPGCLVRVLSNTVPLTLTPGKWRLEGQDCTPSGQCAEWFTDTITVVKP